MGVATVVAAMPPVTVIVLYPPFCVVWIVWNVCVGCTVCVIAGVPTRMSVGVTVTPFP
jgi:hypothetical protein